MWNFDVLTKKYTQHQLDKLLHHKPVYKNCCKCGIEFDAQSYHFRPTAIYPYIKQTCSDSCRYAFAGTKNKKVFKEYYCVGCNSTFVPRPSKPHQQFCSKKCKGVTLKGKRRPDVQKWIHKIILPKGSISKQGNEWLAQFPITHVEHIIRLGSTTVRVDGFDGNSNTVYEYLGSFWHGNPAVYNPADINPVNKKTFGQLYSETVARLSLLESAGYKVVTQWSLR